MKSKSNFSVGYALLVATSCVLLGLSGCAASHLKADYNGYEDAFAYTSNREMLLNLARLNQHDPTYFFKLGQIGTSYRMQATVAGTGNFSVAGTSFSPTGGGNPGVTYEKDPAFTFIPVNDDTTAKLLLQPIQAGLFESLYQQGWRADQLFRLMVDRIEFCYPCDPDPEKKAWQVIHNTPSPDNIFDYSRFLRVSAIVYYLQKHGWLLLRGQEEFVPLGTLAAAVGDPGSKGAGGATSPSPNVSGDTATDATGVPRLKIADVVDALVKNPNLVWRKQEDGTWELDQEIITPRFELHDPFEEGTAEKPLDTHTPYYCSSNPPGESQLQCHIEQGMPALKTEGRASSTLLAILLVILKGGFTIEENSTSAEPQNVTNGSECHLVMRSMIGLMSAAAQEQDRFDNLLSQPVKVPDSLKYTLASTLAPADFNDIVNNPPLFKNAVPEFERRPILKLTWGEPDHPDDSGYLQPIAQLTYRDKQYLVTDCKTIDKDSNGAPDPEKCGPATTPKPSPEASEAPATAANSLEITDPDALTWNRDVFRLISQITAQVTVDISKFPLPQILQLHTD